jgi:hypothetical protein
MQDLVQQPEMPPAAAAPAYPAWAPRFWHGMRFGTWMALLARNRFAVSPQCWPLAASITIASMLNTFATVYDRLLFGHLVRQVKLLESPLFVLGHWRSGTTLLHELLILDSRHICPTTYQCFEPNHFLWTEWFLPGLTRWILPATRPMDNMAAGWGRPQEDEFALCNLGLPSPYLAWAFPNHGPVADEYLDLSTLSAQDRARWKRCWKEFILRVAAADKRTAATRASQPAGRIVLKSPTHTARVRTILEVFPDARFVHIVRDPLVLYPSTVRLWQSLSQSQGLQVPRADAAWMEGHVLDSFVQMYERFERDRELIRPGRLVDVRYEDLVSDPVNQMRQVYGHLNLGEFARVEPAMRSYAREMRSYRTNTYALEPELAQRIRRRWAPYFERYGYSGHDAVSASA